MEMKKFEILGGGLGRKNSEREHCQNGVAPGSPGNMAYLKRRSLPDLKTGPILLQKFFTPF